MINDILLLDTLRNGNGYQQCKLLWCGLPTA